MTRPRIACQRLRADCEPNLTPGRALRSFSTLRRIGAGGEALIQFVVTVNGTVADAFVVRATDIRFGQAALDAVRQWTFQPGRVNGQPVATTMQVPIVFQINEG